MSYWDYYNDDYPEPDNLGTYLRYLELGIKYIEEIILKEVESFNIREFHNKYWSINDEKHDISLNDCYDNLRIHIFRTFFEIAKDDSFKFGLELNPAEHYSSLNKYLMNLLIKFLINEDGLIEKLTEKCKNIGIPDDGYYKVIKACGLLRKLNDEQEKLLDIYSNVIHKTVPALKGDPSEGNIIEQKNMIGFDTVDADLIFRLYLHGDKEISPSTYLAVANGEQDSRSFDKFIVWLWDWAQEQKPSPKIIPKNLKVNCTELISTVCTNNDQTKYTERDFNVRNPNESWKNFQQAVNDSKKRIKENSID